MRFMKRVLSIMVAASSMVFALPVRADDPARLGKDDGFRERVLLARERTNPDGSMKQRSLRTEVQIEKAAKSDDQASHAKSSTNSNIDDAFSDPILSSGP